MEAYYRSKDKENGVLSIAITNIDDFAALIKQAKEEADQLQRTINQLTNFNLDILISSGIIEQEK